MKMFLSGLLSCAVIGSLWGTALQYSRGNMGISQETVIGGLILSAMCIAACFRGERRMSPVIALCMHVPVCLAAFWTTWRPLQHIVPFLENCLHQGASYIIF